MEMSKDTDELDVWVYSFRMGKDREMDNGIMDTLWMVVAPTLPFHSVAIIIVAWEKLIDS